jgi:hypothetical protein
MQLQLGVLYKIKMIIYIYIYIYIYMRNVFRKRGVHHFTHNFLNFKISTWPHKYFCLLVGPEPIVGRCLSVICTSRTAGYFKQQQQRRSSTTLKSKRLFFQEICFCHCTRFNVELTLNGSSCFRSFVNYQACRQVPPAEKQLHSCHV